MGVKDSPLILGLRKQLYTLNWNDCFCVLNSTEKVGSSHLSCHDKRETSNQCGRNSLILFSVPVFEWKTKEHCLKKSKQCLFVILTMLRKDLQSVTKVVWFIQSPSHGLKESTLFSVDFSLIDIHWFHCGLNHLCLPDHRFSVWPKSNVYVKLSNTTLIFMLTDRFTTANNFILTDYMTSTRESCVSSSWGNSFFCTGVKTQEVIPCCTLSLCPYNYFWKLFKSHFVCAFDFLIVSAMQQPFIKKRPPPWVKLLAKHMCYSLALCTVFFTTVTLQHPSLSHRNDKKLHWERSRMDVRKKFFTNGWWAWNKLPRPMVTAPGCWSLDTLKHRV